MKKLLAVAVMVSITVLFSGQSAFAKPEMGLRISLGVTPGVDKFEVTGPSGNGTADMDAESGVNLNPAFVIRTTPDKRVGFVGVIGPFVRSHDSTHSTGNTVELAAFGVSLQPGLAVKLSDKAHLEIKGELGLGAANQSITGYTDGSGPYVSVGVSAGAYFKLGKTFVLGGDIGYSSFTSTGELDVSGVINDSEFTGSGPVANLSVGWMF